MADINNLEEIRKLHGGLLFYQGYDSVGDESGYEGEELNREIWEVDPHTVDDYGGLLASCDQIRDAERFIKLLNSIPGLVNEIEIMREVLRGVVDGVVRTYSKPSEADGESRVCIRGPAFDNVRKLLKSGGC